MQTVMSGSVTAKKLCTAFGIRAPAFLEGMPDQAYFQLLSLAIDRELQKRVKLPYYNTITDVVSLLMTASSILVLTGAGISTSLGVPDFRSADGLYAKYSHLFDDPQEIFDLHRFEDDPTIFYTVAKDILPSSTKFSPTHAFIRLLQDKGKLLTNFTQNIDNLESHAGVRPQKLIQCHGSFAKATCMKCGYKVDGEVIFPEIRRGVVAKCERCRRRLLQDRPVRKRKYNQKKKPKKNGKREDYEDSTDEENDDIPEAGVMKVS